MDRPLGRPRPRTSVDPSRRPRDGQRRRGEEGSRGVGPLGRFKFRDLDVPRLVRVGHSLLYVEGEDLRLGATPRGPPGRGSETPARRAGMVGCGTCGSRSCSSRHATTNSCLRGASPSPHRPGCRHRTCQECGRGSTRKGCRAGSSCWSRTLWPPGPYA